MEGDKRRNGNWKVEARGGKVKSRKKYYPMKWKLTDQFMAQPHKPNFLCRPKTILRNTHLQE